jgi:pyruvate dehydrogenase E2 component (dihydrolipoamide acetyltransferase)
MNEKIILPELGDGIEAGDVVNILVSKGDEIEKDSVLFELETDKAVVEFPSPQSGRIMEIHIQKGDTVTVGQLLVTLDIKGEKEKSEETENSQEEKKVVRQHEQSPEPSREPETQPLPEDETEPVGELLPAGPATRKLARELGLDLSKVQGTASGGRITLDDVKSYVKHCLTSTPGSAVVPATELPDFSQWGPVERKPLSSLRRKVAENLGAAWSAVPLVTQFDEADITELENLRKKYVESVKEKGGKLTITIFVMKALVTALKAFPQFNATLNVHHGEIIYKQYFNIGVAVATPSGLIVPVMKNVDGKSLAELAIELTELSQKVRDRKVPLEDLRGGNISVSNLGGIGGTGFTPLVNPPDVAVVGLSRSRVVPVWQEGKVEPRFIMPFSVSYDHRVIDGADGARFARLVAHEMETFQELLLEG